jgi:hypothetical protein
MGTSKPQKRLVGFKDLNTYPVEISVRVFWHVVVEYNVDSLDIHTTTKQVCGNQDTFLEVFELFVPVQSATETQKY